MGQYPHHRSYRAYRGSSNSRRRLSKGARRLLGLAAILILASSCTAIYLGRYMVYSIYGGHLELPNQSDSISQEQEEPLDLSVLILEDTTHNSFQSSKK